MERYFPAESAVSFRAILLLAITGMSLAACSDSNEKVCNSESYPVWSVKYPESGAACVRNGREPDDGYATYPPGLTPAFVSDIVDCDRQGECTNGPLAISCPDDYPKSPCTIAGTPLPTPNSEPKMAPGQ